MEVLTLRIQGVRKASGKRPHVWERDTYDETKILGAVVEKQLIQKSSPKADARNSYEQQ